MTNPYEDEDHPDHDALRGPPPNPEEERDIELTALRARCTLLEKALEKECDREDAPNGRGWIQTTTLRGILARAAEATGLLDMSVTEMNRYEDERMDELIAMIQAFLARGKGGR